MTTHVNGLMSPPATEKAPSVSSPPRVILSGDTGKILCVADIRGDYHELNRLIKEHDATAVIHTGDFGFINAESLDRMGDKILRHLLQYSPLIPSSTRQHLLSIPTSAGRNTLINALNNSSIHFPLSQFPHLLSGAINFTVPVFTVWGLIEDVRVLERFRTGEYEVKNLTVIDEACSNLIETSGVKLRLFGLGGAVAAHKLFDHGEGHATIAGGQGTMWATALQVGELIETAQKTFDPTETRIFVSSAPVGRNGILSLLSNSLKADLTVSGGLHFRYPSSFNEFAVHQDFGAYQAKLEQARDNFMKVYASVKVQVDASLDANQQVLLNKAMSMVKNIPLQEDDSWTNTWHWVLSDASCGYMLFSITDGRISAETKSQGLNFAHRAASTPAPPTAPVTSAFPVAQPQRSAPQEQTTPVKPPAGVRPPPTAIAAPPKPVAQPPTAPVNHIRNILPRAQPSPAAVQKPPQPTPPVPSSVPTKPPTQPRQPRAAQTPTAPARDKVEKPEPPITTTKSPAPTVSKSSTPAPGAKSSAPPKKPTPVPTSKKDATTNGPTANGKKEDVKAPAAEKEASMEPKDAKAGNGEKEAEAKEERAPPPKKHSLYLKGIPIPTTEEQIKALFPGSSKFTAIKIIQDHINKKQKDFAYVDFETEEDMQAALKEHKATIGETTVNVSISNPPARGFPIGFRGAPRGSFRGGRGGAARGSWTAKKDEEK